MSTIKFSNKISFSESGFFFIALIFLALAGFWPSYFSKLFAEEDRFSFYIHFHAFNMMLWVVTLVAQPMLIHYRKNSLHRTIGKFSYVQIPVMFVAAILLVHSTIPENLDDFNLSINVFIPFKDLIVIGIAWTMAMVYRKRPGMHARFMICTSIPFIEPALVRAIGFLSESPNSYLITIAVIDSILLILMIRDWKYKAGRNIFGFFLLLYIVIQAFIIAGAEFEPWKSFAYWFAGLNIS